MHLLRNNRAWRALVLALCLTVIPLATLRAGRDEFPESSSSPPYLTVFLIDGLSRSGTL